MTKEELARVRAFFEQADPTYHSKDREDRTLSEALLRDGWALLAEVERLALLLDECTEAGIPLSLRDRIGRAL